MAFTSELDDTKVGYGDHLFGVDQIRPTGERELEVELQVKVRTWGTPGRHERQLAQSVARAVALHLGLNSEINVAVTDETAPGGVRYEAVVYDPKKSG